MSKRPSVLDQIDRHRDGLIEASAGTGKTYTIEHLVLALVLEGVPLPKILLVTFTEKATQELKDRLRSKLRSFAVSPDSSGENGSWLINGERRDRVRRALFQFEEASIDTIHGYCNRILRELAFDLGRRFELSQINQHQVFDETFRDYLRREVLSRQTVVRELLHDHLVEAPEALEDRDIGFAKTLLQLAEELLAKRGRILPDVLSAQEAWSHWLAFLAEKPDLSGFAQCNFPKRERDKVNAFLKLCDRALENPPTWSEGLAALSDVAWLAAPSTWKFNKRKSKDHPFQSADECSDDMRAAIEVLRAVSSAVADVRAFLLSALLPELREAVTIKKRDKGWFDFDDMIRLVAEGVRHRPDLVQAMRDKHQLALIDEFQDTDDDQWTIFSTVFLESPEHRLYLIGDPKQAIYGFRGADIHAYLAARDRMDHENGVRVRLDENYRSSAPMIEAINAIFTPLFDGAIRYEPVRVGDHQGMPPHIVGDDGPAVLYLALAADEGQLSAEEARRGYGMWLAEEIARLLAGPPRIADRDGERWLQPRDIAVLTRTRREGEQVGEILKAHDVPFAFYKQGGLFDTDAARDLLTLLRAIDQPNDEARAHQALLTLFFPVTLDDLIRQPALINHYLPQLLNWRRMAYDDRNYRRLFSDIFRRTKVFERLLFLDDDERRVTDVQHLADLLQQQGAHLDLRQLIAHFEDLRKGRLGVDEDLLRLETERQAVQIMTVHASKGLEFSHVFVYGGYGASHYADYHEFHERGERVIDLAKRHAAQHQQEQREEQLRLTYVALTRAKHRLYLTRVPSSKGGKDPEHAILNPLFGRWALKDCPPEIEIRTRTAEFEPVGQSVEELETAPITITYQEPDGLKRQLRDLKFARNRFRRTSYTHLARLAKTAADDLDQPLRAMDEAQGEVMTATLGLPKGRNTGICLHEILERVDDLRVFDFEDVGSWRQDMHIQNLLNFYLRRAGLGDHFDAAAQVVWQALRSEILGDINVGGLAPSDRLCEVDFHYRLDRGATKTVLNGSIDLAFRKGERYYFADWKSDALDRYDASSLGHKVEANYEIQIEIYLWAMLRWLHIRDEQDYERRFGGLFYLFIRGMNGQEGVYYTRPDWREALAMENRLRERLR